MWILYILLILLALMLLIIVWVLLARIIICIDSNRSLYYIEMWSLFRVQLHTGNDQLLMRIKVPFRTFEIDLIHEIMKPKPKKNKEKEAKKKKEKKKGRFKVNKGFKEISMLVFRLLRSIHHSFRVQEFYVNMDTGNYPLNAQLFPIVELINRYTNIKWRINFKDQNEVQIIISNRLIRIVIPIVKTAIRLYT